MKFRSPIFSQVSGSIGGTTFAHNRGGLYTRNRRSPTNTPTPARMEVRAALAAIAQRWFTGLSDGQRSAWADYAAAVPVLDAFGQPTHLTGQQMFIRCNSIRDRIGYGAAGDGPVVMAMAGLTAPTLSVSDTILHIGDLKVDFTLSDDWTKDEGGGLVIQLASGCKPTRTVRCTPLRYFGNIPGVGSTGPPNPSFLTPVAPFPTGCRIFYRLLVTMGDARLSQVVTGSFLTPAET